jgi:hypothetical protein
MICSKLREITKEKLCEISRNLASNFGTTLFACMLASRGKFLGLIRAKVSFEPGVLVNSGMGFPMHHKVSALKVVI